MPHAKDRKPRTRARIVRSAQRLFRALGYADTSIETIMRDCGLTRGGFYAHFASKAELYAEAIAGAANDDATAWQPLARDVGSKHAAVRAAYGALFTQLAQTIGRSARDDDAALARAAMTLGALVLAQSVDDAALKQRVAAAVRAQAAVQDGPREDATPVYFWAIDPREARRTRAAAVH
jgi:TetR/AcrR family transcriptional regulator, transcriptional repressor for nem operon